MLKKTDLLRHAMGFIKMWTTKPVDVGMDLCCNAWILPWQQWFFPISMKLPNSEINYHSKFWIYIRFYFRTKCQFWTNFWSTNFEPFLVKSVNSNILSKLYELTLRPILSLEFRTYMSLFFIFWPQYETKVSRLCFTN